MLRVMKKKAKGQTDESSGPSDSLESVPKTSVDGNVPQSISISSPQVPFSSNSSVSSDDVHTMAPLTRVSDDETERSGGLRFPAEDSRQESSIQVSKDTAMDKEKRPRNNHHLSRRVSESDLEQNVSTNDVPPPKRLKATPSALRLLSMPEDSTSLNPLHVFVREQIEVFTATPADMAQPAPGRKNPVKLHQVGLRCIHCRHLKSRDRVKRAVCYPSSVSRIYHSVSDMKFDHFSACKGMSPELRVQFELLKKQCKRGGAERKSSKSKGASSTAQYYRDSACKLGLEDSKEKDGIFMAGQVFQSETPPSNTEMALSKPLIATPTSGSANLPLDHLTKLVSTGTGYFPSIHPQGLAMYHELIFSSGPTAPEKPPMQTSSPLYPVSPIVTVPPKPSSPSSPDCVIIARQDDEQHLNPLHCFVRRNVEVFRATKDDVAAPSPGRKTRICVGQVGIRCIHCVRLAPKERVKRAVCYPPSVSGIYHSVSNMKFDHFGACRGLSPEARAEFTSLRNSGNRRNIPSGNSATRSGVPSSTAQYYEESAVQLGLVDTETGIRFRDQCQKVSQEESVASLGNHDAVPDGISVLMIAATDPEMRAEFDRRKALGIGKIATV